MEQVAQLDNLLVHVHCPQDRLTIINTIQAATSMFHLQQLMRTPLPQVEEVISYIRLNQRRRNLPIFMLAACTHSTLPFSLPELVFPGFPISKHVRTSRTKFQKGLAFPPLCNRPRMPRTLRFSPKSRRPSLMQLVLNCCTCLFTS